MNTRNAYLVYPSTVIEAFKCSVGEVNIKSVVFDISKDPDEAGQAFLISLLESIGYHSAS